MMYRPPRDTSLALILNFWPILALMSNSILLSVNRSITQRYHPERAARCQGTWGAVVAAPACGCQPASAIRLTLSTPAEAQASSFSVRSPLTPIAPSRLPSLSRISAPPRDDAIRPSEMASRAQRYRLARGI